MNTRPLSKKYLCKRLLLANYSVTSAEPFEADLLEVSPSEEYAKIKFKRVDGTSYTKWYHVNDYVVLEELEEEPGVNMKWIRELEEKERKDQEDFKKYSSPTAKPSYWDTLPTSICSSDYADAPDWHATNYNPEVKKQKCNDYSSNNFNVKTDKDMWDKVAEVTKQKWVHGICNPPSPDWKKK
jgi:hypothetical protein